MSTEGAVQTWLAAQWRRRPEPFRVDVDGTAIACHGWNLAATDRAAMILVHGFRAHAHWWDHIAPSFADRYRVVALSLSGMGDSDTRETYGRRRCGREIVGVAQACGFEQAILVTHSFGTLGALLAVNAAPERFTRMVMIDAGLPLPGQPDHIPVAAPRRVYPTREAALERFRLMPEATWPAAEVLDYIAAHSIREAADGWTWKFDPALPAKMQDDGYRDGLGGVPVPVDIVYGADTTIMTPERVAEARRLAPRAGTPIAIPGSGHHVMIEQPLALVATLCGLLANPRF